MKYMSKKFALLIVVGLLGIGGTTQAFADCNGLHCTNVTVDRLYVDSNTNIGTSGAESNLFCDPGTNGYLTLDRSHPNYDSLFTLLHHAHNRQDRVWVRVSNTGFNTPCKILYVVSDK